MFFRCGTEPCWVQGNHIVSVEEGSTETRASGWLYGKLASNSWSIDIHILFISGVCSRYIQTYIWIIGRSLVLRVQDSMFVY